jgi:hypothetical protein
MDSTAISHESSTWSFDPPREASIRAHCTRCGQSVTVLKARIIEVAGDRYRLEGRCKRCGEPVRFTV